MWANFDTLSLLHSEMNFVKSSRTMTESGETGPLQHRTTPAFARIIVK